MIPKTAKGKRPIYLDNAANDQLLAIIMALVGEVAVLRERLDTIERLATAKGLISTEEIEQYQPNETIIKEREQWREEYLNRILRILEPDIQ